MGTSKLWFGSYAHAFLQGNPKVTLLVERTNSKILLLKFSENVVIWLKKNKKSEFYRSNHRRCNVRNVTNVRCCYKFCKIHRKAPVPEPLFDKVAVFRPATLLKKRLSQRSFPVHFAKFLRTPFLQNTFGWLLLVLVL